MKYMRKLMIFCAACLIGISAMAQAEDINAVKFVQGQTTDWYLLNDNLQVTFDANSNPTINGKTYDLTLGAVETTFDTAPVAEWVTVRTGLTESNYGTLCLEKNVTAVQGATLWSIASINATEITLQNETSLEAGQPCIFIATATELKVQYGDQSATTAGTANGLNGTFVNIEDGALGMQGNQLEGNYIIYNNEWRLCGAYCGLHAHSAYLVLPDIQPMALTPGRATMRMPNPETQTPTALDNLTDDGIRRADARKVVYRGNLYILRDSRIYNAQGQKVK